ncbi:g3914 [Coccomyxa elongata]
MAEAVRRTKKEGLEQAKGDVIQLLQDKKCHPILIRLGWHDAGTYNKDVKDFPHRGGANGSIRFYPEINHGANAGLVNACKLLQSIADKYDGVSYADLFQMASALAVKDAGGPSIPMRYGRKDAEGPESVQPEGNLPAGGAPWPNGEPGPGDHLRKVFYRMGFTDQEIVALSGAHTVGRAYPNRSGFGKESTKYTKDGPGTKGGSSWTPEWLVFDNSYFKYIKEQNDNELLVLETDDVLFKDEGFRPYAEKYAADQDAFFADYAKAHAKLSELGVEWDPSPIPFAT